MTSLYLSRIKLNPKSPAVARDLSDAQAMHCKVMSLFPDGCTSKSRETLGVLYRPESDLTTGVVSVIIQSTTVPNWRPLSVEIDKPYLFEYPPPDPKRIDHLIAAIVRDQTLRFRLRANPTKRVLADANDKLAGKRVNLLQEEDRRKWLERKLTDAGCEFVKDVGRELGACTIQGEQMQRGIREGRHLSHGAVVFDGIIHVKEPDLLRAAIRAGIGSGKAYGFGLLSVAPGEE